MYLTTFSAALNVFGQAVNKHTFWNPEEFWNGEYSVKNINWDPGGSTVDMLHWIHKLDTL